MKVEWLSSFNVTKLKEFNKLIFSERVHSHRIIDFWFSKKTDEHSLSIVLKGDNDVIWGQNLHSSMFYYYQDQKYNGEWGFDFIIKEDIRKNGYGIDILLFALRHKETIFAVGSGSMALKIELKMGFKLLGDLKKYVGFANPLYIFTSLFRGIIPIKNYPSIVEVGLERFIFLKSNTLVDNTNPFNSNLLEIGRDKAFLKWRFFSELHEYAFYKRKDKDDYFVVRTIIKNQITILVLVDYRCNFSNPANFRLILKAVKQLASKLNLAIIITGSSLKMIDSILENNLFKSSGRARPIIVSKLFKDETERVSNREFIFITLADSDGEINW